jgi:hypothetical protein
MLRKLKKLFNAATETPRAALEYGGLVASWKLISETLPRGDGHPVLIIPGFLTGDMFTYPLRARIEEQGYKAYAWENGVNFGLDQRTADHLRERLAKIYAENGNAKVTLIGHSLGGVFARELAREFPGMVRGVITLGTPFGMLDAPEKATSAHLKAIYKTFNPQQELIDGAEIRERGLTPPPVPTTSVFSRQDGVVEWEATLNPAAPRAENIEVYGSHMGMCVNPLTLAAVLDRLAQKEGEWQPFNPLGYLSLGYPSAPESEGLPKNPRWQDKSGKSIFKPKN